MVFCGSGLRSCPVWPRKKLTPFGMNKPRSFRTEATRLCPAEPYNTQPQPRKIFVQLLEMIFDPGGIDRCAVTYTLNKNNYKNGDDETNFR